CSDFVSSLGKMQVNLLLRLLRQAQHKSRQMTDYKK
ncbi:MAG: hypothetical protein ACI88Z_002088, partial [Sphingobacteriales bacterium]